MKTKPRWRFAIMGIIVLAMMAALIGQLAKLTLAQGEEYAEAAASRSTRTVYTTSTRGRILDSNGIPLAYDETSYNVQFTRDPERRDENSSAIYTESLLRAIAIIEACGYSTIDTSYIYWNENTNAFAYNFRVESESGKKARYKNFLDAIGETPKNLDDMSTWLSAEDAYNEMRRMWKIPTSLPMEDALKVISIRQEINLNQYRAYEPITIAYNVSMETVARLDMISEELDGISTTQSTSRVYPWGETASHIVGYLSRQVSDEATETSLQRLGYTQEEYKDYYVFNEDGTHKTNENGTNLVRMTGMGYSYNDYIGVEGVERTMEKYLTASTSAQRGTKTLEVNKIQVVTREIETTSATAGNDVMLTVDLALQQVVEQALQHSIDYIREVEEAKIETDKESLLNVVSDLSKIKKAESGSIVVLEVDSGKTLAMASNPSYDPNRFIAGLTPAEVEELFGETSGMPTLNRAIASRLAPGSIFKMATGLAGLMEGVITTETRLSDGKVHRITADGLLMPMAESTEEGRYTTFISTVEKISVKDAPKCWVSSGKRKEHEGINLSQALTVSCNYYFATVADAIGITRLNYWATQLGLNDLTGIELPGELVSHIGGQQVLYDNTVDLRSQKSSLPGYVYSVICDYLKEIVHESGREVDEEAIKSCAGKILRLQDGGVQEYGEEIRKIMSSELGLPVTLTRSQSWSNDINMYLSELQWKAHMTIRTGFGQASMLVTPVAIARYAAALVNGGTVYDVHIVDRILDENGSLVKVVEPSVFGTIDAPENYWTSIAKGLEGVLSPEDQGTAAGVFSQEFRDNYQTRIIGKSGTAETSSGSRKIDIENTSWFITMLPKDDPEIVIVTCIPYGLSGSKGAMTAIDEIVRFYLDRKDGAVKENLVGIDGIMP
ncbi:hypothetical protein LJC07_00025 [Christensenellaceae bacterium OttesenSCG-928-L17]|nr:hypothetical protein [Christensenellaceae bacterium OttesenSCG-928-L17]